MELLISPDSASPRAVYRLGGERVTMDVHPEILRPFLVDSSRIDQEETSGQKPLALDLLTFGRVLDAGMRRLGDTEDEMSFAVGAEAYRLDFGRCGAFVLTRDGTRARCLRQGEKAQQVLEAALGPVLILALALRGMFSLHGSAVEGREGNCVDLFLGESGAGKSTRAAFLALQGHTRLADDITVVDSRTSPFAVHPDFPQLKLTPDEQSMAEKLPLRAIYLLRRGQQAAIHPIAGSEAVRTLLAHTVASRCFAPELAANHLEFCREWAQKGSVRVLEVPWGLECLGEVAQVIYGD